MKTLLFLGMFCAGWGAPQLHAQNRCFPPDAVVNVTQPPYNARPGEGRDNTLAIQRAITDAVGTGRVLFFPVGVYNISGTLVAKDSNGLWRAHLTLQGQSREKVVLRLVDHAPGFGSPDTPKPVLMTGSHWEKGDSLDGGGNKAFRNNLFDLTIDTGSGNPGAVGIEYAVSNFGSLQNVSIQSGDGQGVAGISLKRRIPGPGLLKKVSVRGFDIGIDIGDIQYGLTLEDADLQGQRKAGIRVSKNLLHARHLQSVNRVPAIQVTAPEGMVTLLDSRLTGGAADQSAVECAGGLLLRNVATEGYGAAAVRARVNAINGPLYAEYCNPGALGSPANSAQGLLPIEETPEYWNDNLSDWVAVGPRNPGEEDDTAAIQRAIDSGKSTVYFQNNRVYFLSDTVVLRGKIRQLLGFGSEISLGAAKVPFSDVSKPRPLFRINPTDASVVFLENLFFNAQYPGEVIFENNSPATVVIKHCGGWVGSGGHRHTYRNTVRATGKLFLEDVFLPGWEFTKQTVWARQFNPENPDGDGVEPQVANRGGRLWILGFKTEGPAPYLVTSDRATTELLGAYNYVSATAASSVPTGAIPYSVVDSTASLTFATDNFRDSDYTVYIQESQGGPSPSLKSFKNFKGSDLWPRNGHKGDRSLAVPLYRSRAAQAP